MRATLVFIRCCARELRETGTIGFSARQVPHGELNTLFPNAPLAHPVRAERSNPGRGSGIWLAAHGTQPPAQYPSPEAASLALAWRGNRRAHPRSRLLGNPAQGMVVSVVIPVFNSPVLPELVARLEAVFLAQARTSLEIILVDDGSPDPRVWEEIEELARQRRHLVALRLTRNFGQHAATLCGLAEAPGEFVVTLDDDLQHAPEDIPALLAALEHADVAIAQFEVRRDGLLRRLASRVKGVFDFWLIGKPGHLRLSAFRALRRVVVDGTLATRTPYPYLPALMFDVTRSVVGVPVSHYARPVGPSGYTGRKLLRMFSDLLVNNSSLVLRVVGWIGIATSMIGFVLAAVVIYRRLFDQIAVKGWASLFTAVLVIGGLLLFSLGVVGEYLVRIIESSEARPAYFVRDRLGPDRSASVAAG